MLCTFAWQNKFEQAIVYHLSRVHSHYHPVLLSCIPSYPQPTKQKRFLFLAAWLQHAQFGGFLKAAWCMHGEDLGQTIADFTFLVKESNM